MMKAASLFKAIMLAAIVTAVSSTAEAQWRLGRIPAAKNAEIAPSAWVDDGVSNPRHAAAGIVIPRNPPGLMLYELRDAIGNGLDTVAQYGSAETGVRATVNIYAPPVPDGAVIAETGKNVILARFKGAKIERDEGTSSGVRRIVFGGGTQGYVTALALARRGPWMITLRVTGTEYRRTETLAAFDALVKGIFPAVPKAASTDWTLPAACTDTDSRSDAPLRRTTTVDAMMVGTASMVAEADDPRLKMPWPAGHITEYCVDSPLPIRMPSIVLRGKPASSAAGRIHYLALLGDAGAMLEVGQTEDPLVKGASLTYARLHLVDRVSVLELYDGWPSRAQVDSLLANLDGAIMNAVVMVKRTAPGKATNIVLNNARLIDAGGNSSK